MVSGGPCPHPPPPQFLTYAKQGADLTWMSTSLRASWFQTEHFSIKTKTTAKFSTKYKKKQQLKLIYMYTKATKFLCTAMYLSVVSLEQNLDFLYLKCVGNCTLQRWDLYMIELEFICSVKAIKV